MKTYLMVVLSFIFGVSTISAEIKKNVTPEALTVSNSLNEFAINFYKNLQKDENLSFSPYSISSAFVMAYNGAKGTTQQEIAKTFHFQKDLKMENTGWNFLNRFLTFYPSDAAQDLKAQASNAIFMQNSYSIDPSFKETMEQYYTGSFRLVDFKKNTDLAIKKVNDWVRQSTFGKIPSIVSASTVNEATRMILVAALYLKAKWNSPFDTNFTSSQPFFVKDKIATVPTMSQSSYFPYFQDEEVEVLELPYIKSRVNGPEFSMLVVLPRSKDGLTNVENTLSLTTLNGWKKSLKTAQVVVNLPKFKITQDMSLNDILKKMGVNIAFSNRADFSNMSTANDLQISNALHKVYVSVDETGSEAAAATAIVMTLKSGAYIEHPIVFKADHPFLYCIYEKQTGAILFMGRVFDL